MFQIIFIHYVENIHLPFFSHWPNTAAAQMQLNTNGHTHTHTSGREQCEKRLRYCSNTAGGAWGGLIIIGPLSHSSTQHNILTPIQDRQIAFFFFLGCASFKRSKRTPTCFSVILWERTQSIWRTLVAGESDRTWLQEKWNARYTERQSP